MNASSPSRITRQLSTPAPTLLAPMRPANISKARTAEVKEGAASDDDASYSANSDQSEQMKGADNGRVRCNDLNNDQGCGSGQTMPPLGWGSTAWSQFDDGHAGEAQNGNKVASLQTRDV